MRYVILFFMLYSCNDQQQRIADKIDKVVVHDTIKITSEDSGMIETVQYFKLQNKLLWDVIDELQSPNPSPYKIDKLNHQITSEREKHNRKVANDLINEFQKLK